MAKINIFCPNRRLKSNICILNTFDIGEMYTTKFFVYVSSSETVLLDLRTLTSGPKMTKFSIFDKKWQFKVS